MDYKEAIEYIHSTHKFGMKLGLHNIGLLLELMGNPHKSLSYVHVAGTNGKGSTVAFISSILIEAGYRVGIYISPFIERFTERIKINGTEIPEGDLARITGFVREKVDMMLKAGKAHPTEFEIITAVAFQYYHEQHCDLVVLEVGLGGRFDSTNIIDTPDAAVITTISFDHMEILGNTLPEIAFEKAGIVKSGGDVVLYPQTPDVERVFERICEERNSRLKKVDFSDLKVRSFGIDGQSFDYKELQSLKILLLGDHQARNAAVAVETALLLREKGYAISNDAIREGLYKAKWPGRMEIVKTSPLFLIDGAHNAEGAQILAAGLKKYFPNKRITFIVGVLADKDYKAMIEAIEPYAYRFVTVTPRSPRALSAKDLAIFIGAYCKNVVVSDKIEEAIRTCLNSSSQEDLICAFGSLYYIGGIRKYFKQDSAL